VGAPHLAGNACMHACALPADTAWILLALALHASHLRGSAELLCCVCPLCLQAKKDHGANAASLAPALQRLFAYGWQQRSSGGGSGSSTPKRGSTLGAAPCLGGSRLPASPNKYRPPHARSSSTQETIPPAAAAAAAGAPGAAPPAAVAAAGGGLGSDSASQLHLESSDSESSDAEGSSSSSSSLERYRASRVRSGALACLQLLAKADPKSLHGSWTTLLPMADAVASQRGARSGSGGAGGAGTGASVAHILLHDPQLRVRHAAAATIVTLLEGPAQRAYLAVAEARELERQPVRCG
jgi:hypothetical protein